MTTTNDTASPPPHSTRRLLRSRDDRVLAGVSGGLGQWLDLDPVIFRVVFAVLTVFGGVGIVLYAIGYLLIPDAGTGVALVSSRLIPDPRRLTSQQLTLIGWGIACVLVVVILSGTASTPLAVLGIVAAVAVLSTRSHRLRQPATTTTEWPFTPPPGAAVPPSAAFAGNAYTGPAWVGGDQAGYAGPAEQVWPTRQPTPPVFTVRARGRTLNRVLISAALLAVGAYLLIGYAGAYDPTFLRAVAVGLTALGAGLALTAWYARSRGALVIGAFLAVIVMVGSAVQGDYGTSVGSRVWRPVAGGVIPYEYKLGAGNATLDLTQLGPSALGKTVRVSMGAGKLTIRVPASLPISAYAHISIGSYTVFDAVSYQNDPVRETVITPGWTAATGIRIETSLRIGNVEVDRD